MRPQRLDIKALADTWKASRCSPTSEDAGAREMRGLGRASSSERKPRKRNFRGCGGSEELPRPRENLVRGTLEDTRVQKSFLAREKPPYEEPQKMPVSEELSLRREHFVRGRNHRRSRSLEELPRPTESFVRCRGSKDSWAFKKSDWPAMLIKAWGWLTSFRN